MGLWRKKQPRPLVTPEDVASYIEDGAPPVDWADVFGASQFSDEEQTAIEVAFGEAAVAVINYLEQLDPAAKPTRHEMMVAVFGTVIAKAEYNLRFRPEFDRAAVEAWCSDQLGSVDMERYPGTGADEPPLPPRDELITEARRLVSDGWYAICYLVAARMSESLDAEGREVEFLRASFGPPSDYYEARADEADEAGQGS